MSGRCFLVACLVLAVLGAPRYAPSHTGGSTGYAFVTIEDRNVRYRLTLSPTAAPPAVSEDLHRAAAGDATSRTRLLDVVRAKVTVIAQEKRCAAGPGSMLAPEPSTASVTLVVDFVCAAPIRDLVLRDDLFDVFGADYHTLARIDAPDRTQFAFTPDTRETRLRLDSAGGSGGILSFVVLGIEHILTGYDHVLFLVGLLLPGGSVLALTKIISAFTVAHSITLSLAVLDVVVLPDRLIEAVIALSIAAVAVENVYRRPAVTRRWLVSLVFGLVHGFGFSSALREMGLPSHGLLLSLFGFNVGVELGQALIVAVALPLMAGLRRTDWEPRLIWGTSMAILLVGLVLFIERAFL